MMSHTHLYNNLFLCSLTMDNLLRRGWHGSVSCVFYIGNENVNHLFFTYPFTQAIWHLLLQLFPQMRFFTFQSLSDFWQTCLKLPLVDLSYWRSLLATLLWSAWTIRNHFIFRSSIAISANSIVVFILHLFSFWWI
jgi:hypothetical protein